MSTAPIAVFRKNGREEVRVGLEAFNGHDLIQVRVWFQADDGEMRPGKAGIALRVAQLRELADAISAALEQARELGLCA